MEGITLYAGQVGGPGGGEELIDRGILKLTYGVKYGMVGRNGVGKSTFLRAVWAPPPLPPFRIGGLVGHETFKGCSDSQPNRARKSEPFVCRSFDS